AGYQPRCIDLFADQQTQAIDPEAQRISGSQWPTDLLDIAATVDPSIPVIFTGGLENHPNILRALVCNRPGLIDPDAVITTRDPQRLRQWATDVNGRPLPVADPADTDPGDGRRWVARRPSGTGGSGVRFWTGQNLAADETLHPLIDGRSVAAAFVGCPPDARLIAVTEQIVSDPELGAAPFAAAGTLWPNDEIHPDAIKTLTALGRRIVADTGLAGPFGIDAVVSGPDVWPMEINPRFTAGMGCVERATGISFLDADVTAPPRPEQTFGRAVVFAREPTSTVDLSPLGHSVTDTTDPGEPVAVGDPICTVRAEAEDPSTCRDRLHALARKVYARHVDG
ncbi:MAG: ATP-grasp domain-containing protein, partial [Phycisphaeraceae bacterium]|nr:ATP-grasp domain-containing protein [Phycisphaeraceae bacterium]